MNVPRPSLIAGIIGTLAFAAAGGAVFDWLTVPLAWLIGAMVITTAAALSGAPLKGPGRLRNVMIGVLGIMLGSAFTPDALDNLGQWLGSLSTLVIFIVIVTERERHEKTTFRCHGVHLPDGAAEFSRSTDDGQWVVLLPGENDRPPGTDVVLLGHHSPLGRKEPSPALEVAQRLAGVHVEQRAANIESAAATRARGQVERGTVPDEKNRQAIFIRPVFRDGVDRVGWRLGKIPDGLSCRPTDD